MNIDFLKKYFPYIVIAVLVIVILLQQSCNLSSMFTDNPSGTVKIGGKTYTVIKHTKDTVTINKTQYVYKPGNTVYRDTTIYINIPSNVDTSEVLKKYYAINVYKDTLKLIDSIGYVAVTDSIAKNSLLSRTYNANVSKIKLIDSIFLKEVPKTQYFAGGMLGIQKPNSLSVGASFVIKTKNEKIIVLGTGINAFLQPYVHAGLLWKLGKK
jgi:hypothetical protein